MAKIDYPKATASQLAGAVRDKHITASELTNLAIAEIEAKDGAINAVVVQDFERARSQAKAIDRMIEAGAEAPLLGVPMTVKESYDVEGLPTNWGVPAFAEYRAEQDSEVVARLKGAGAIILGKTNVPPYLVDWHSQNDVYGRTNNPHDLSRSPGGSSGGAAAALAAGMVPLEYGSDIGGSIRFPASFCGVYGHKTSHGIVPMTGHIIGGIQPAAGDLGVGGPLARCAEDLALALGVTAGPDGLMAKGYKLTLPPPRHRTISDFRILVIDNHPRCATDTMIQSALAELANRLDKAGARVSRQSDLLPDLNAAHGLYLRMLLSITTRRTKSGRAPITVHEWFDARDAQFVHTMQWAALFDEFDAVICPAFGSVAFPHTDEPDWAKRTLTINGEATPYGDQLAWASIATLPNLPSTAFPLGKSPDGLPFGGQIIGAYLEDLTTIELAGLIGGA